MTRDFYFYFPNVITHGHTEKCTDRRELIPLSYVQGWLAFLRDIRLDDSNTQRFKDRTKKFTNIY